MSNFRKPLALATLISAILAISSCDSGSNKQYEAGAYPSPPTQSLPFPDLPATYELSSHKGQQGCVISDGRALGGINDNEGLKTKGYVRIFQTNELDAHKRILVYGNEKGYGYHLYTKDTEKTCIDEKIYDVEIGETGNFPSISKSFEIHYEDSRCDFTPRYTKKVCGSFETVSNGLIANGFYINYQGRLVDNKVITMLSGNGKSYQLTTNQSNGITVLTGVGKHEFAKGTTE